MIYISTGGIRKKKATDVALDFFKKGLDKIELSGGLYSKNYEKDIRSLPEKLNIQIHNYYPPPKKPFVFNLASNNEEIAYLSIKHVKNSIRLCSKIGSKIFAFHAGFRIDPSVKELGNKLNKSNLICKDQAIDTFTKRVSMLSREAEKLNINLMIENNVISKTNIDHFQENPLLFTNPHEISEIMNLVPENIGFLLDVGHLKVSSQSLGFNLSQAHKDLYNKISAYHLSDNDGITDQNKPVTDDSWFWNDLKSNVSFLTLEIYNSSIEELVSQKELVENKLNNQNKF